jgi:[glutamine synthetase] adenylyltransferase / [glutamine synthetase]-adenylyl-L-tyrosine phosphorylase
LQLCHAAADSDVLDQNTIASLERLAAKGTLPAADSETLVRAAKLEHAVTQVLRIALSGPFEAQSATRGLKALLARAGDAPDFGGLEAELAEMERQVRAIFDRLLPPPGNADQR